MLQGDEPYCESFELTWAVVIHWLQPVNIQKKPEIFREALSGKYSKQLRIYYTFKPLEGELISMEE